MPFGMSAFILIDDMTLREWTHYISNTPAIVKTSLMEESASHQATVALLAAKSAKKQQLADQESEHETVDVGGGGGRLLLLEDNSSTKNKKRNRPSRIVTTTSNDPNNNGGKQRTTTRRRTGDDYSNGHNHHSNPHLQSNSIPSSGGSEITTFEQFDIAQALSALRTMPMGAGAKDYFLSPSTDEMQSLFIRQSALLRQCLQGHAQIRKAYENSQEELLRGPENRIVTLGEGRLVAEQRVSNENLRVRLKNKDALIERMNQKHQVVTAQLESTKHALEVANTKINNSSSTANLAIKNTSEKDLASTPATGITVKGTITHNSSGKSSVASSRRSSPIPERKSARQRNK